MSSLAATKVTHITHCIFRLDFGGLENGLVNLANCLPRKRFRQSIICLAGFNPEFKARITQADVNVYSLEKRPGKDLIAYFRMWQLLRRLRPDVLHTRNLGTIDMQWVAAAAGVRRRVHGEHGWEASDPTGANRKHLRIRRACAPAIHRFVAMSADIASWLTDCVRIKPNSICRIYNGVDVEKFHPATIAVANDKSIRIGAVGRLDPVKNFSALLQTVSRLKSAFPRLQLEIVGDGPQRQALRELAVSLDIAECTHFAGARGDIAERMRSFDLFVLPSVNEGISNTILEAMATGLPVVANRVGGNPELIVDGVTGRLYDGAKPYELDDAVRFYLADADARRAHGAAGRIHVVKNFSLEAMVTRYMDFYDRLVS